MPLLRRLMRKKEKDPLKNLEAWDEYVGTIKDSPTLQAKVNKVVEQLTNQYALNKLLEKKAMVTK